MLTDFQTQLPIQKLHIEYRLSLSHDTDFQRSGHCSNLSLGYVAYHSSKLRIKQNESKFLHLF